MKKIFCVALLLMSVISIQAQKVAKGSFKALANEKAVAVNIDYTESIIDKMPFEAFLEIEENWEEGYHEIMMRLITTANKNSHGLIYSIKKETDYKLVFKATKVNKYGNTAGYLQLLDKENNVVGETKTFFVDGGRVGSQTNLMGDASERLGKIIAHFIKKQLK